MNTGPFEYLTFSTPTTAIFTGWGGNSKVYNINLIQTVMLLKYSGNVWL